MDTTLTMQIISDKAVQALFLFYELKLAAIDNLRR